MSFSFQLLGSALILANSWPDVLKYNVHLFQQMQLPFIILILVLALEQFTWILLAALEGRLTLLTALKHTLVDTVFKTTQRMQE